MPRRCLLLSLCLVSLCHSLFPGAAPYEGDIRHLYPRVSFAVSLRHHSAILPFLLGWLENIDYPKKRLTVDFYLHSAAREDPTSEQIKWWRSQSSSVFSSVHLEEVSAGVIWQERALAVARKRRCSFLFLWDGDDVPFDLSFLFREVKTKEVVTTFLVGPPRDCTEWNVMDAIEEGFTFNSSAPLHAVESVSLPLKIFLDSQDSDYLTFDGSNVYSYEGERDALSVLAASAQKMGITLWLSRSHHHSWHFPQDIDVRERTKMIRYLYADLIGEFGQPPPLTISRSIRPFQPEADTFVFDKVLVVNLARRPERRSRMQSMCAVVGLACDIWTATDGASLSNEDLAGIQQLRGYLDPYYERPMKAGEVGCFLSHYRIWEEMVKRGWGRVLILEDDARFAQGALESLGETMEDLERSGMDWHLIYLGRKILVPEKEKWVGGIRHLTTVGYSYWTIGYALSLEGAEELLFPHPLSRLLPVDEYIPLLADVHPNREWSSAFQERKLKAFSVSPLLVFPQRYKNENEYVSDTEASDIIFHDSNHIDAKKTEL